MQRQGREERRERAARGQVREHALVDLRAEVCLQQLQCAVGLHAHQQLVIFVVGVHRAQTQELHAVALLQVDLKAGQKVHRFAILLDLLAEDLLQPLVQQLLPFDRLVRRRCGKRAL